MWDDEKKMKETYSHIFQRERYFILVQRIERKSGRKKKREKRLERKIKIFYFSGLVYITTAKARAIRIY